MGRRRLTEKLIEALRPADTGKRYLVMDSNTPGLGVRVGGGRKTFVLIARFGKSNPAKRALGAVGKLTLDEARDQAREWQRLVARGIDPKRPHSAAFADVCEDFFLHIKQQRKAREVERSVRREFISRWRRLPVAEITRRQVLEVIDAAIRRGSPYSAHNLLGYIRRIFNWAIARGLCEHSPCDRLRPRDIIGPKAIRQRVLTDAELRRLWTASACIRYPCGPLWQLLLLTGQRKSEVAEARWSEFDLEQRLWTIPSERFKSNASHRVPLSPLATTIVQALPRRGPYLFTTTGGLKPINGFGKSKRRLDAELQIDHFVIHDIRRTVRTRLSGLRVPYEVAEMVIGHGRKGLARVYDQHHYIDEMRAALDLWASHLSQIVENRNQARQPEENAQQRAANAQHNEQHAEEDTSRPSGK